MAVQKNPYLASLRSILTSVRMALPQSAFFLGLIATSAHAQYGAADVIVHPPGFAPGSSDVLVMPSPNGDQFPPASGTPSASSDGKPPQTLGSLIKQMDQPLPPKSTPRTEAPPPTHAAQPLAARTDPHAAPPSLPQDLGAPVQLPDLHQPGPGTVETQPAQIDPADVPVMQPYQPAPGEPPPPLHLLPLPRPGTVETQPAEIDPSEVPVEQPGSAGVAPPLPRLSPQDLLPTPRK